MHIKGEGVPQSYVEAVKWFRLAAEQGYATSQAELGIGYTKGEGVPQKLCHRSHVVQLGGKPR